MDTLAQTLKICTKCKKSKPCSDYYKHIKSLDGIRTYCKVCSKKYNTENRTHLRKTEKEWRLNNPEKVKDWDKKRALVKNLKNRERWKSDPEFRDKKKNCSKQWKMNNKDEINAYKRNYRKLNLEEVREKEKLKLKNDINFKLGCRIRSRIKDALKNNKKPGSSVKDLGCSLKFLKQYLEAKFQPGMTWENYSYRGWHIDHIIPLSKFNLTNREEFLKAVHYTNLQPLWAYENMSKGNRI